MVFTFFDSILFWGIQFGMKGCVGELEYKGSSGVERIREYRDGLGMWKEWMSTVWPE